MTKLKFDVAHQVPGRVRMKIPGAKGNPEMMQQIAQSFAAIPGIERITVNPTTGSLVIHYDADQHDEFHGHFHRHAGHPDPNRRILLEVETTAATPVWVTLALFALNHIIEMHATHVDEVAAAAPVIVGAKRAAL